MLLSFVPCCSYSFQSTLEDDYIFKKISILFFFLAVLGLHCCIGFSLVALWGGYSLVAALGLLIVEHELEWSTGSRALRLQQLWLPGSTAQAQ